jgi:hypothetical protein
LVEWPGRDYILYKQNLGSQKQAELCYPLSEPSERCRSTHCGLVDTRLQKTAANPINQYIHLPRDANPTRPPFPQASQESKYRAVTLGIFTVRDSSSLKIRPRNTLGYSALRHSPQLFIDAVILTSCATKEKQELEMCIRLVVCNRHFTAVGLPAFV